MSNKNIFTKVWEYFSPQVEVENLGGKVVQMEALPKEDTQENAPIDDRPKISVLPGGRISSPPSSQNELTGIVTEMTDTYSIVNIQFIRQMIPILRALISMNPDLSQALHNNVALGNTGHKITFDRKVSDDQQDKMRNHLMNKRKLWASGQAGMDGVVNKMISQLFITGAVSMEWVPDAGLNGIESCVFVNPEDIVFVLDKGRSKYVAYQRPKNTILGIGSKVETTNGLIKLNPNTYRYFALNGDSEMPYGIPPFLPAVPRISSQNKMFTNIDFIVDTMGLIGFLEALIEKPTQRTGENDITYAARLSMLLNQTKSLILGGVKDGVIAGFKEDHEFKFNSASKSFDGVTTIFQENELQIASATKQDAALWGRGYSTSETQITVVFQKLLSELRNIHNILKEMLEFGYGLELRLAGFEFDSLQVKFNRSTLQDDYKFQQAEEIKIRNAIAKYIAGLINHEQLADELGYETAAEDKPLVDPELLAGKGGSKDGEDADKKTTRKKGKVASDKKTRKSNQPNPKDK